MFKKLLIPLDRSALAEQALGPAAAIARAARAAVDVVLVHDPRPVEGFTGADNAELVDIGHRYVEEIAGELAAGASLGVSHAVLTGEPVEMLSRRIWEDDIDLVVMTSHGRTGFSRFWIGSVANGLVHRSGVPVMVLRPTNTKQRVIDARHLPSRILVPLDGSTASTSVLPAVASLARCGGARVTMLRVVRPAPLAVTAAGVPVAMPPISGDDPDAQHRAGQAREWLTGIASAFHDAHDVDVDAQVVIDPAVAPAIIEFARGHDIGLIAMSTLSRGVSRLLCGSVADKVLRGAELPMLLFHSVVAGQTSDGTPDPAMSAREAAER